MKTLLILTLLTAMSFGNDKQMCGEASLAYKSNSSKLMMNSINRNVEAMKNDLIEVEIAVYAMKGYCEELHPLESTRLEKEIDSQLRKLKGLVRDAEITLEMIEYNKRK